MRQFSPYPVVGVGNHRGELYLVQKGQDGHRLVHQLFRQEHIMGCFVGEGDKLLKHLESAKAYRWDLPFVREVRPLKTTKRWIGQEWKWRYMELTDTNRSRT